MPIIECDGTAAFDVEEEGDLVELSVARTSDSPPVDDQFSS
jgi:hypothetical protein